MINYPKVQRILIKLSINNTGEIPKWFSLLFVTCDKLTIFVKMIDVSYLELGNYHDAADANKSLLLPNKYRAGIIFEYKI